jgi:alpha/beta superfamily hydrolase
MNAADVIHEKIRFDDEERLSGILSYPTVGQARLAVLVCSPHPNFGGDLENNVIVAMANRLATEFITLRFDYRGVGQSRIEIPSELSAFDYWENIEQTLDYTEPLSDTAIAAEELWSLTAGLPMVAVGYSFGAIMATRIGAVNNRIVAMAGVAPPLKRVGFEHLTDCRKACLLISGQDDFVYDASVAENLVGRAGHNLTLERPAGDHFFIGAETELADRVARFVGQTTAPMRPEGVNGSA